MIFMWNVSNVNHIWKHKVTPAEAEYVVKHAKDPYPRMRPDGKYRVWGQTEVGRYLQVIFVNQKDENVDLQSLSLEDLLAFSGGEETVIYVIHANDLTDQKKKYRKQ